MPPEDAETCKSPGIFFSKPCNLFKKKLLLVFYSADFRNLALFYVLYCCWLSLPVRTAVWCWLLLLRNKGKAKPSLICPWSHCQQTSAAFYFLCSAAAWCWLLLPAPNYICKLLFVMISTRCLMILSADTYYCNTHYKRSAAYACCLHQVSLRTPLKKGRCSRTPWNSWNRHSLGEFTNTTILLLLLCFTDSFGLPLKEMLFKKGHKVPTYVVLRLASYRDVADLYHKQPLCSLLIWN